MKIAYFTDTFYPDVNGVAHTLKNLGAYLCDNGVEHMFFAPDYEKENQYDLESRVVRYKGIKPVIYPQTRISFPLYRKEKEIIDEFAPDLIHVVTELGIGRLGLMYARKNNIPIVMSYHTNYDHYLNYYRLDAFEPLVNRYVYWFHNFAQVNLCPSTHTIKELRTKGYRNLDLWTRGVDAKVFSPAHRNADTRKALCEEPGKTIFLFVGRVAAEKGLDYLMESIKMVNSQCDNAHFVFTGDGPYLEVIRQSGIKNITLTGFKRGKELAEIYASSDVFVFPSGTETFGNVALEAMASGLPVICVNAGGVMDFAVHNENAHVCPYKDAQAMADAILLMARNRTYTAKLASGAARTANDRSWDHVFDGLMQSYEMVLTKESVAVG